MLAFFRSSLTIGVTLGAVAMIASAANATPVAKPAGEASTNVVKVNHDDNRDEYRHDRRRHGRNVVHAPFTRVESGRRTVVDAPFVHVYKGRHGKHIVAPFVDIWR